MRTIDTLDQLRAMHDTPSELVRKKCIDRLDDNCRRIIGLSPFLLIATANADGRADVSPRGDPPGFVTVLDDKTIAIPERPGNNLMDSLTNLLENPEVGLIFLIPGMEETLRVNGTAILSDEPELVASMAVDGKVPKLAVVVTVREAFLHCAKAFRRSRLWDEDAKIDRSALPTLGAMLKEMVALPQPAEDLDARIETSYREKMY